MTLKEIIKNLESLGTPENITGMKRFGIVTQKAFGVSAPNLKELAKKKRKVAKSLKSKLQIKNRICLLIV